MRPARLQEAVRVSRAAFTSKVEEKARRCSYTPTFAQNDPTEEERWIHNLDASLDAAERESICWQDWEESKQLRGP